MTTDTTEKGLETLIVASLHGQGMASGRPERLRPRVRRRPVQLAAFLAATQPTLAEALDLGTTGPTRQKFLARLQGEITKRGVIDVLRNGIKHGPHDLDLFYGTPSPGNAKAAERLCAEPLQRHPPTALQPRRDASSPWISALFINGLPVATFELKNSLTKQTVDDAVEQYKRDRDPRELLSSSGAAWSISPWTTARCGSAPTSRARASWFLPFNQGWNDGAGNPPNPDGIKTDYLWKRILTPHGLTDILENYAQVVEKERRRRARRSATQIFPRYHQLDVVRKLLADAAQHGAGQAVSDPAFGRQRQVELDRLAGAPTRSA